VTNTTIDWLHRRHSGGICPVRKIHTDHSLYPRTVSQIFLQDAAHVLPKLFSYEEHCRRDRWEAHRNLIAVYLRCKCYSSFSRLLRHPWKKERGAILLFCPRHHKRHKKNVTIDVDVFNSTSNWVQYFVYSPTAQEFRFDPHSELKFVCMIMSACNRFGCFFL
jgi:hypothetical protein